MQQIYINGYFKGFNKLNTYSLLKDHPQIETIEKRLKIINFFNVYGEEATREAFDVARSTVYLWRKKLKEARGRLTVLTQASKAPKNKRQRKVNPLIINFIKDYRTLHPGVCKETIKPALDKYCRKIGIPSVSESTIGRIIKDLKEKNAIVDINSKLSFFAKSDTFKTKPVKKRQKKLRRGDYQPNEAGDLIQMDTITIFYNGLKRYFFTAYDIKTGFAFAYCTKCAGSQETVNFFNNFKKVAPFNIKRVQTDNGSEFMGLFRDYAQKESLIHFFNYPRRPQSNPFIERFNRTIQEQYIRWHKEELYDINQFNKGLMEYLIWYNTEKPHKRLNKNPPLKYYLDSFINNRQESNMLWTTTQY